MTREKTHAIVIGMEDNLTLPKQRVLPVSINAACCDRFDEFSIAQKMQGETLDTRYRYLHEIYYDLLEKYRQTDDTQQQCLIAGELELLENEMAQILLKFETSAG